MTLVFPDASYAQVVMKWNSTSTASGEAIITFGVQWNISGTLGDVATAFATAWDDEMAERQSDAYTLVEVNAFNETTIGSAAASIDGGASSEQTPPNTAVLVEKVTATRGPRGRGRVFLPGYMPESEVNDAGVIDPGTVTAIQANVTAFYGALLADTAIDQLVIIQNAEGISSPLDPPPEVTALTVDAVVATQRNRLR